MNLSIGRIKKEWSASKSATTPGSASKVEREDPQECLWGQLFRTPVVNEERVTFKLDLGKNQNFPVCFLDMRYGRRWGKRRHSQGQQRVSIYSHSYLRLFYCPIAGGADFVS